MATIISKQSKSKVYHLEDCPYAIRIDKKYKRHIEHDRALALGYHGCSWCGGLHGAYLLMKKSPTAFGEKPRKSVSFSWDNIDKALCFRTDEGFWKVLAKEDNGFYRLWHLNHSHFDNDQPDKVLMRRAFHRQADVDETRQLGKIISYISEHDRAKKIIDQDWKQLPKKTQKQRRYYRQAKRKARRKEHQRIDEIFRKIEKGEL